MNARHRIAMAVGTAVVLLGLGGAVAAAHPFAGVPQTPPPAGPAVDLPEPGDVPDAPGPDLPEPGDVPDLPGQ